MKNKDVENINVETVSRFKKLSRKMPRNCDWGFQCKLKLADLAKPIEPDVYQCGVCDKRVYDCHSTEEFEAHVEQGHCVLFDRTWLLEGRSSDDEERLLGYPDYPNIISGAERLE